MTQSEEIRRSSLGPEVSAAGPARPVAPITAKLGPPRIRPGYIKRPALHTRLNEGLGGMVTLISAPAGYGKSTLVSQWVEDPSVERAAWLSLDRFDNELERFCRYVVAALQRVEPGCLSRLEALLSAPHLPPPNSLAESMLLGLQELDRRLILVLDDYGALSAETIHEFLRCLVPNLADALHVVILTRLDPPFPLSLWRSRHWLHELRGADLRFSRQETEAFFTSADFRLSDEALDNIHRKTEGWIAGLALALLSLKGSDDPEGQVRQFSGAQHLIVDYLTDAALARQPAETREFLALTAPLERFCPALCDELMGGQSSSSGSKGLLEQLLHSNTFLFNLDDRYEWYRYHHLFRDLLLDRFDELAPATSLRIILLKAGNWFAREGWIQEALQYLLAGGDVEAAAGLVAENLHDVLDQDPSRRTLGRWLALFPPSEMVERLPLIVASLYMMVLRLDIENMVPLLKATERVYRNDEGEQGRNSSDSLRVDLDALWSFALFWSGDPAGAHERAARVVDSLTDPGKYPFSLAIHYFGGGLALTGRRAELEQFVDEGVAEAEACASPRTLLYLFVRAVAQWYWGELESSRAAALESLAAGERVAGASYFKGQVYFILGVAAYEQGRLDEAESYFQGVEGLRFDVNQYLYHEALLGLAYVALARGDQPTAKRFAAAARDCANESGGIFLSRNSDAFERRLGFLTGNQPPSLEPPTTLDFMYLSPYPPSYTWAWLRLHDPSPMAASTALSVIDQSLSHVLAHGVQLRVIQFSALRAMALDRLQQREEAVEVLEKAVRDAERLGLVRSFLDCGPRLTSILLEVVARNPDFQYAANLLKGSEFRVAPMPPDSAPLTGTTIPAAEPVATGAQKELAHDRFDFWEELTNRELDVLELLQKRLANKEIAARLFISPATVKTHTLSIYRKLGVQGRRKAVAEALRRKILD